jgi:serine protease Do
MRYILTIFVLAACAYGQSNAQTAAANQDSLPRREARSTGLLRELDGSLEQLVSKVSPAVVQILVSGYGPAEAKGHTDKTRMVRQHAMGSGVIVDPDGYIMTNAHVVEGAQRVRVIVPLSSSTSTLGLQPVRSQQLFDAKIVGRHKQSDLALLKIEATQLPAIALHDDVRVRQGELVLAIGSPEGLRNSVTMGVVSSVARQTGANDPMFYVQTDAPLNPGNSGGPLVDLDGNLVGINTFMLSEGGGNEGLGFAIPASIVNFDYDNLRKHAQVHRVAFGAEAQAITPTLAAGLGLSRSWGVVISNVTPGGFARIGGIEVGDIVLAIDTRRIDDLPSFIAALYLHPVDQGMKIDLLRGAKELSVFVPVMVHQESIDDLSGVPDVQRTFVPELNMFVSDIDEALKPLLHGDQDDSGVVVVAESGEPNAQDRGVQAGDVLRALNRTPLQSVSQLQATVRELNSGDPIVLQVERGGKLQYIAFEMD